MPLVTKDSDAVSGPGAAWGTCRLAAAVAVAAVTYGILARAFGCRSA